jgi:alkylation response protein AidB-like acyl-CoA dehydrogenase
VARWRLDGTEGTRTPLATGAVARRLFESARRDWRILTAAALVGVSQRALEIAVEYAKVRHAFGVPIGTFQAISHPMADTEMAVETARRLARKAAWHVDHEEPAVAPLDSMALLHASETATKASHLAIHVLGGIGFTLEADAHLCFRKAKGYVLCGGDPKAELLRIADVRYGPVGAGPTER